MEQMQDNGTEVVTPEVEQSRGKRLVKMAALAFMWILPDLLVLVGAAAITYGAWRIYKPAGYIAGGAAAIIGAILLAKSGASSLYPEASRKDETENEPCEVGI